MEASIFRGLAGEVWIDQEQERLTRLDAHVIANVDFGWGILGKLDKGGTILLEQSDIGGHDWELTDLKLNLTGKALLVKSLNIQMTEQASHFSQVPPGRGLSQGHPAPGESLEWPLRLECKRLVSNFCQLLVHVPNVSVPFPVSVMAFPMNDVLDGNDLSTCQTKLGAANLHYIVPCDLRGNGRERSILDVEAGNRLHPEVLDVGNTVNHGGAGRQNVSFRRVDLIKRIHIALLNHG